MRDLRYRLSRISGCRSIGAYAIILCLGIVGICLLVSAQTLTAQALGTGDVQGHAYINDSAELLTDSEEQELYETMKPGLEYGNMVFITIDDALGYNSSDYIEMLYQTSSQLKGSDSVIYMIDMDNRLLWITGYGALKETINPDYANLITDNVYRYASDGRYGECAIMGYAQIVSRITGGRVSGPLRTAGNFSIALILSVVICFLIAYLTSSSIPTKRILSLSPEYGPCFTSIISMSSITLKPCPPDTKRSTSPELSSLLSR